MNRKIKPYFIVKAKNKKNKKLCKLYQDFINWEYFDVFKYLSDCTAYRCNWFLTDDAKREYNEIMNKIMDSNKLTRGVYFQSSENKQR